MTDGAGCQMNDWMFTVKILTDVCLWAETYMWIQTLLAQDQGVRMPFITQVWEAFAVWMINILASSNNHIRFNQFQSGK